jgi:hypothetical protein
LISFFDVVVCFRLLIKIAANARKLFSIRVKK